MINNKSDSDKKWTLKVEELIQKSDDIQKWIRDKDENISE